MTGDAGPRRHPVGAWGSTCRAGRWGRPRGSEEPRAARSRPCFHGAVVASVIAEPETSHHGSLDHPSLAGRLPVGGRPGDVRLPHDFRRDPEPRRGARVERQAPVSRRHDDGVQGRLLEHRRAGHDGRWRGERGGDARPHQEPDAARSGEPDPARPLQAGARCVASQRAGAGAGALRTLRAEPTPPRARAPRARCSRAALADPVAFRRVEESRHGRGSGRRVERPRGRHAWSARGSRQRRGSGRVRRGHRAARGGRARRPGRDSHPPRHRPVPPRVRVPRGAERAARGAVAGRPAQVRPRSDPGGALRPVIGGEGRGRASRDRGSRGALPRRVRTRAGPRRLLVGRGARALQHVRGSERPA